MKKLIVLSVIFLIALLLFVSCRLPTFPTLTTPTTPIPYGSLPSSTSIEASDDIVFTPGGVAYRANVFDGSPHSWPSIQSENATLGSGSDTLTVTYRPPIETKVGENRNNIIDVYKTDTHLVDNKLELYSVGVPDGIVLINGGGGGLMGELRVVLAIEVNADVAPGQYTFKIGIEIDGKDYGTIPCTINVIE
jgi:hypothetical protein